MNIKYVDKITVSDYNHLRTSVGWTVLVERQAQAGIDNSAFLVVANVGNNTVGMVRLITDGGYIAFIADVMVLPKYQKNGGL